MARGPAITTDETGLLAEAGKEPRQVYLIVGEPFQTEGVAHALIDILVPPEHRGFNLERYDGRTTKIGPVLDSLRMRGLFPGRKLVWVRESTLFLSREKRSDVAGALFRAWAEDRHTQAADRLLTLAALAGWTQERFAGTDWMKLSATALKTLLGRTANDEDRTRLAAVAAFCDEQSLKLSDYKDEGALLEDFLAAGMPPACVLLFTASAVDHRKRTFRAVGDAGAVLEMTLEHERSGALSPASVEKLIERSLGTAGKTLQPAARRLILQRAGNDAAALATEMDKLCLYVGNAGTIGPDEVRDSFRDLADAWIFDFTRALSQRQTMAALQLLRGLFAHGEHPLRLTALIARELRLLLLARDLLDGSLADAWGPRVSFPAFRDRLWPRLDEEQRASFAGVHPYGIYLALQNAQRADSTALQRAVLALHQLDLALKSSAGDPHLLVEALVLDLCRTK